jgi:hypothetical protein
MLRLKRGQGQWCQPGLSLHTGPFPENISTSFFPTAAILKLPCIRGGLLTPALGLPSSIRVQHGQGIDLAILLVEVVGVRQQNCVGAMPISTP